MVCSEPLISEDAPPQWKCICLATYLVPSGTTMCMEEGRLIITRREDEGREMLQVGVDLSGLPVRHLPTPRAGRHCRLASSALSRITNEERHPTHSVRWGLGT